jgi:hypothetical protein
MGRNSVDATKACLIRAVRAVRAALLARPAGFRLLVLDEAGFPAVPDRLVEADFDVLDFAVVDGFFDAVEVPVFAGALAGIGFLVGFGLAGVEALDFVAASPEDCPATGVTTISRESRPDRQRNAIRETEVGKAKNLMSSLYAAFPCSQHPGTTGVTA